MCKPSDKFYISRRIKLESTHIEAIFADVILRNDVRFLIAVAYIPPADTEQLKGFLEIVKSVQHEHIIITGDFNAKSQEWHNSSVNESGKLLETFLPDSHMICINDGKPTRRQSDSIIDLFISSPSLIPKISMCETLTYENILSDHLAAMLEIERNSNVGDSGAEEKNIIGKIGYSGMRKQKRKGECQ